MDAITYHKPLLHRRFSDGKKTWQAPKVEVLDLLETQNGGGPYSDGGEGSEVS